MRRLSILVASGACLLAALAACGRADEAVVATAESAAMRIEFDRSLRTRVISLEGAAPLALTDFEASDTALLKDDVSVSDFAFVDIEKNDGRTQIRGRSAAGLEKTLIVTFEPDRPAIAGVRTTYINRSEKPIELMGWIAHAYTLKPPPGAQAAVPFYAYAGASFEDRRDWVQAVKPGFAQENFMGMNASDYGSGTPILDVWRKDAGLAVGHLEPRPRLVSLPLKVDQSGARLAVRYDRAATLAPGESFSTFETFVAVHEGDYFATLRNYAGALADRGFKHPSWPATAYEPIWCAWGYERDFSVEEIRRTLPKVKALGLEWAGLDDGWQTNEGDWNLDPQKFPGGDADMAALVKDIHDAGLKAKLWVSPLAVDPGSDILHDHPEMLLLDKDGAVEDITWWNAFYICPAYEKTVDATKALVRRAMETWGFDGLKIDGQHLNGVPPCYNPAHHHERPEESIEGLQDFWKAVFETATMINKDAVIEICPCGTSYSVFNTPFLNQTVASDPLSSFQVRMKGKTLKGLMGPNAPYAGDHIELSDGGRDFASTLGVGGVVSTKFTWPSDRHPEFGFALTAEKEAHWAKWISLYRNKMLSTGAYRGDLYDIGFDRPEAHAVEKDGRMYYAFYADDFEGEIELRGLGEGAYRLRDYVNDKDLGEATGPTFRLAAAFMGSLLIEAAPAAP